MMFSATFNNISVISWRSIVLFVLVEDTVYSEKTIDLSQVAGKQYCCIEYISPWVGFELTTLVMIGTDCTGNCKSNYSMITTTTAACHGILTWWPQLNCKKCTLSPIAKIMPQYQQNSPYLQTTLYQLTTNIIYRSIFFFIIMHSGSLYRVYWKFVKQWKMKANPSGHCTNISEQNLYTSCLSSMWHNNNWMM